MYDVDWAYIGGWGVACKLFLPTLTELNGDPETVSLSLKVDGASTLCLSSMMIHLPHVGSEIGVLSPLT